MKPRICERCGAGEFSDGDGYSTCQHCNTRYVITAEDVPRKESSIALDRDIARLLQKCQDDPANARRYASLILDIDPNNDEALRFLID